MNDFFAEFENIDNLPFYGVRLPEIELTEKELHGLDIGDGSHLNILKALCRRGYQEKILKYPDKVKNAKKYVDQIKHELGVLEKTKFLPYILLVWQVLNFCRENDIPYGKGRGSGAGSVVNYLLYITDIDPIENGLFFERFVSENRAKSEIVNGVTYYEGSLLPDLDLDLCMSKRHLAVSYLENKYQGRCCRVSNINSLQTKVLIKEVGKIVGQYDEDYLNVITSLIPKKQGKNATLDECAEASDGFARFANNNPQIIEISKKLYEGPKNYGVHASAYLLSYEKLEDLIPCHQDNDGNICSVWDKNMVENFALKLDLLGLNCVTIIDKVAKEVGISLDDIHYDSYEDIYKYLQDLQTPYGLFQIEGPAVVKGLNRIKPKCLNDLSNIIAIIRPGAMDFVDNYVDETYPVDDEQIKDILKETKGVCIFQESMLRIGKEIFGLTADESEQVRRAVSKKKEKEVAKWLPVIEAKSKELNIKNEVKDYYLKVLSDSAGYSFNKCLSPDTIVETESGPCMMYECKIGDEIKAFDVEKQIDHFVKIEEIFDNEVEIYEVEMEDGRLIQCSLDHKFLVEDMKMHTLREILQKNLKIITD